MDSDGVVRWVASQSPNPALQALMKEAECDRKSSNPVHEPASWTNLASSWRSSLSGGSLASSSSMPPSGSRRAKPASRKPLASSTSSANRLHSTSITRARSSSSFSNHSLSNESYVPGDEGPEAMAFIELLKDVSRQLDENSRKKQRLAVRAKEQERSLGNRAVDHRTPSGGLNVRPLVKTSSASAIVSPIGSTARTLERSSSTVSVSMTDLYHSSNDGNSPMQDVIDLTETDTEWESPIPGPSSTRVADTAYYMQVDDSPDDDVTMDTSFFQDELPCHDVPPKLSPVPILRSQPQPQPRPTPPPLVQRARTSGPPPLGMRRVPQLQPSQYGTSSQVSKGSSTMPRFKPPLLPSAVGAPSTNKVGNGSRTKPVMTKTTTPFSSRPSSVQRSAARVGAAETGTRDPDSSFDISFGVDADALEEAMKAYD